jgi:hypothetical protein
MSDNGRQSLTDKVSAAVKVHLSLTIPAPDIDPLLVSQPDSEKSNMEHIGDKLKGAVDSAAEKLQPNVNILYFSHSVRNPDFLYRVTSLPPSRSATRSLATPAIRLYIFLY